MVGLLHAMAFMVLLLIGWVIWNNKPLPLPMFMHFFMEFVNKPTGLRLHIPKRKMKMNLCSIWPFAQVSDDFYYLDIWQCSRYFVTALFKELALITMREMWGLESLSRTSRSRSRRLLSRLHHCAYGHSGGNKGVSMGLGSPTFCWATPTFKFSILPK